jgi:UTP--glucose-1-phosphate uridylyltransferase
VIRKALIPAGGLGTRLAPLTHLMPKEMLPLGNRVVLQYVVEECDAAGLDTLLVVLNRRKTALFAVGEETQGPTDPITGVPKRSVYFANQEKQGGLAHALLHGEAFVGDEPFVVALGDSIVHRSTTEGETLVQRMVGAHEAHNAAVTLAAQWIPDDRISRYGVLDLESEREVLRVRGLVEKPRPEAAPSRWAITARYVFSPEIFAACREVGPSRDGEIDLTRAMSLLAQRGRPVIGVPLLEGESRLDIGNPQSYAEAFRLMAASG